MSHIEKEIKQVYQKNQELKREMELQAKNKEISNKQLHDTISSRDQKMD
jgi:hypothetical protein